MIGVPLLISEVLFRVPRNFPYKDLQGYTSEKVKTSDGKTIQLWYTQNHDRAMLVVHGHFDNSGRMECWYRDSFANIGYDLIFIDLRNHGRSTMTFRVTIGMEEYKDVEAALLWMGEQNWKHIIVFGTSMGGIASSIAVPIARRRGIEIRGLILDSIFSDTRDTFNRVLKGKNVFEPYRSLINWLLFSLRFKGNYDIQLCERLKSIGGIHKLVIHGDHDVVVDPAIFDKLKAMHLRNFRIVLVEGGIHSRLFMHPIFREEIQSLIARI